MTRFTFQPGRSILTIRHRSQANPFTRFSREITHVVAAARKRIQHGARAVHKPDPAHTHTAVNQLRIERGVTHEALATLCGVSLSTIMRVMAGAPGQRQLRVYARVAAALQADPLVLWPHLANSPDVLLLMPARMHQRRAARAAARSQKDSQS